MESMDLGSTITTSGGARLPFGLEQDMKTIGKAWIARGLHVHAATMRASTSLLNVLVPDTMERSALLVVARAVWPI